MESNRSECRGLWVSAAFALSLMLTPSSDRAWAATPPAEWTLMVFMNGKNNLEPAAFDNFRQMAKVGSNEKVNVLVEFGRPIRHYPPADQVAFPEGQWSRTLRFRVQKSQLATPANAVEDLGKVDMGSGRAVADFVSWSKEKYPAKHCMLVIWDHGQGWRFYAATTISHSARTGRYPGVRKALIERARPSRAEMIDTDEVVHGIVRYSSIDEDIGSRLYNRDLQDVLKRNGEKLDIVAWDACLMSMIETSYAMRDVSQILVGSQELEPGAGWNYEIVLDKLTSNPTMGPTELAKVIVDAYQAAYHGSLSTTMAATDLSKVGRLADSLSLLSDQLRADLVKKLSKTCAARSACHTYAPGYGLPYIDLGRFLEQIESQSDDPVERDRAKVLVNY